jgi:excisionase family DNA binding protein
MSEPRPLLTLDEVAARLKVSRDWVRDHASRKEPRIRGIRFGDRRGVWRFRSEDVEAFITAYLQDGKK